MYVSQTDMFESHLYGIETPDFKELAERDDWFESHLYGIETSKMVQLI